MKRRPRAAFARVVASVGDAIAGYLLSIQLTAAPGGGGALRDWLCETMPALVHRRGIVGAHYLEGDAEASRVDSKEKQLRSDEDAIADRVVLIGGYDADLLETLRRTDLPALVFKDRGAGDQQAAVYRLLHCTTEADLAASSDA